MRNSTLLFFIALLLSASSYPALSQDYVKFGQVDPKYFTMEKYENDTAAEAFFIFNEQTSIFDIYQRTKTYMVTQMLSEGIKARYEIHLHRAIKILDENATMWGDFTYSIYKKSEKISSIKGFTYNMENGKVVKSKLTKDQIVYEDISNTRERVKVSMPNVKKGSVIELEVNIESEDFYSSGPWQMQHIIPVERNILVIKRPEYHNYNRIFKGYYPIVPKYDKCKLDIPITIKMDGQGVIGSETMSYTEYEEEYIMNNVPAFPVEPYLSTPYNYLSSLMFELSFTRYPGTTEEYYNTTWEAVNKKLLENEDLGLQIKNTRFLEETANELKGKASDDITLATACFEYVRDNITCNNTIGIFCHKSIKDVMKDKKGDVAGMNLLLIALLREAGIKAYPVILSTRSNGFVQMIYPSISDFNYLICMAEVGDQQILLDASDKYLTVNLLDPICLNDKGRIIDVAKSDWIELTNTRNSYHREANWEVSFNEEGTAKAVITETYDNIAAYEQRDEIRDEGSFEKYIEEKNQPDNGYTITASSVENQEDITKPLVQKLEVELNKGYLNDDLLIFSPIFTEALSDNPFKIEKREYPVEYPYPQNEKVIVRTVIPEGYEVESLPKSANISALNNSASFVYNLKVEDGVIVTVYEHSINRMIFLPSEYAELKDFYRKCIESQNENVVLIKKQV